MLDVLTKNRKDFTPTEGPGIDTLVLIDRGTHVTIVLI